MNIELDTRDRLLAILAADVAGYSRLMSLDDRATVAALDRARAIFRTEIAAHGGRVIDMAGDSVLATFQTATAAMQAAMAVQSTLAECSLGVPEDRRMRFRIGLHVGDVIEKADGSVYGDGVNVAARLEGLATPGGVTVSHSVYEMVSRRLKLRFVDLGEQAVKNIKDPIRTWNLDEGDSHAGGAAIGSPRKQRWAAGALLGLATLLLGFVWYATGRHTMTSGVANANGAPVGMAIKVSVAVLPFKSMNAGEEDSAWAEGLRQGVSGLLSGVPALKVSGSGVVPAADKLAPQSAGYRVQATVRRTGDKLHASAQLVQAADDTTLWSESFDREMREGSATQDELAFRIASTAHQVLRNLGALTHSTDNSQAWQLYLQAERAATAEEAEPLLQSAWQLDPRFAAAHVLLAKKRFWATPEWLGERSESDKKFKEARTAINTQIESALRIDPNLTEAHVVASQVALALDDNFGDANRAIQFALQSDPNNADAHNQAAQLYMLDGRAFEALTESARAAELTPTKVGFRWTHANRLRLIGRLPQALEQIERAVLIEPTFVGFQTAKAEILFDLDRREDALAIILRSGTSDSWSTIRILALMGQDKELAKLQQRGKLGADDQAFLDLLQGRTEPFFFALDTAHWSVGSRIRLLFDASLDGVRNDARFKVWLKKYKLTEAHARAQDWLAANRPHRVGER